MQAALLRITLPHLDRWCDGRRAAARAYDDVGPGRGLRAAAAGRGLPPAWHLYVVRHPEPDELAAALKAADIGHKAYYRVPATASWRCASTPPGPRLPVTDELARTHLAIPMSPVLERRAGRRGRRRGRARRGRALECR